MLRCLFILALLCSACSKYPIHAIRIPVNKSSLASEFTKTKDFREMDPIIGEQLLVLYSLHASQHKRARTLQIELIYKDLSYEKITYNVSEGRGTQSFFLLGEKFKETKGILTYKISFNTADDQELCSWSQKMWFERLKLKDRKTDTSEPT